MKVRRVITETGDDHRSRIAQDGSCPDVLQTPMFSIVDIWRMTAPADPRSLDVSPGQVVLEPAPHGLLVRKVIFHPDKNWKGSAGYGDAFNAMSGTASHVASEVAEGMHVTRTVDIAYVVSGEVVAVLETVETVLKAGDTLIQRATQHAWSNRTDVDAAVVFTQVSTHDA